MFFKYVMNNTEMKTYLLNILNAITITINIHYREIFVKIIAKIFTLNIPSLDKNVHFIFIHENNCRWNKDNHQ